MRVFLNATLTNRPYGGANSFLRSLVQELRRRGIGVVFDLAAAYDVALINALSNGLGIREIKQIRSRGIPIVHRKVGYKPSGSAEMRRETNGVIEGDRRQLEFEPYVDASIFQSRYSFEVFRASGYSGAHWKIIPNGVDPGVFSQVEPARFFWQQPRRRRFWDGGEVFRLAISTWSSDPSKGFQYYTQFDALLEDMPHISVDFVGRMPRGTAFKKIRAFAPMKAPRLASFLRRHHGYLAFSQHETCSNALLEAISCGLQVIYLDSGSYREFAGAYGVEYAGDFRGAVRELLQGYAERQARMNDQPFDIGKTADGYISLLQGAIQGLYSRHPPPVNTSL